MDTVTSPPLATAAAHPLPSAAFSRPAHPFGLYLHVPFCATRCGYCDFNTYTAGELGSSASPQSWLDGVRRELESAAAVFAREAGAVPTVDTVFVGGGTPSLLGASGLTDLLDATRAAFDLAPDAEVTTESNPESTSPAFFDGIRAAGYTRVSLGMQSAAPHVLAALDRTHTPGRAVAAAREAADAGFTHVNLDLIYGTPGEEDADLDASLAAVIDAGVDHVSAYALIVEDGTALARRVRRGEIPMPDDDVLAARYERIDATLGAAGFAWYEVSNFARGEGAACRHNLGYWDGGDWWGIGPGAHSHVGGTRFWNVKHPARYAETLAGGLLPVADSEVLTDDERHLERVMLTVRLRTGVAAEDLHPAERDRADDAVRSGLLDRRGDRYVLTDRGRLLADGVVRDVLD
ncbi:oxygen-independent coproporphyrinogen-3 oxidase [Rhodococcoides kroppenstedtii]|uniref:Heme chaperone HemW n=1 Tax=Rhodococcoides kroppenstedtii TaxID=293050 RepID=A0A1I0SII3_9NOCA|nr:radical SAM family heme chaperone HemW [Rhodococcus kroppenstedtii]MBT1193975.1 coproporphyrinogen III oxidase [Rhodococcus kroppenstedtii]SFA39237.1 oxygen-independent coproporphyrinogen-3 oxidase [Rhodococcus kroppenstedtii]